MRLWALASLIWLALAAGLVGAAVAGEAMRTAAIAAEVATELPPELQWLEPKDGKRPP